MKQIIPFNKEITFKTMIGEINSISLEHTLDIKKDNNIKGDFIVSGSYKMTEASTIAEEFSYKIPVDIYIDEEYSLENSTIDIDDFKYSIINDDTLDIKIDVLLDNIEMIKVEEVSLDEEIIKSHVEKDYLKLKSEIDNKETTNVENLEEELIRNEIEVKEEKTSNEESIVIPIETTQTKNEAKVESLFNKFSDEEDSYATYKVYIVRENDSLESITQKYKISIDDLREYNNVDDLKLNDKLIIPSFNEKA